MAKNTYDIAKYDGDKFNQWFMRAYNSADDSDFNKIAAATNNYVQIRLRENAFCKAILKPMLVTPRDCQREIDSTNIYFLEDVEPDSIAMRISMRGEPEKEWVTTKKYEIRFQTLSSKRFQLSETDLFSVRLPLFKIIEQNTVKDLQEQEDQIFMDHVNSALFMATTYRKNDLIDRGVVTGNKFFADGGELMYYLFTKTVGSWPATGTGIPAAAIDRADGYETNIILSAEERFTREVLREVAQIPVYRQMRGAVLLMHEATYMDVLAWSTGDAGYKIVDEIVVGGYKYNTFSGYTFVTTIRDNELLMPPKTIYIFPEERFMGKFLILQQTKFWMKKEVQFISMQAWETVGAGFGNILGIGCVVLKGGRLTVPVQYQDSAGALVAAPNGTGSQEIINNYKQATIPATIHPIPGV